MSLEQVIAENTAALNRVAELLAGNAITKAATSAKTEAAAKVETPAVIQSTAVSTGVPEQKAETSAPALDYKTVSTHFLQVVNKKGRDAAAKLLADFGVPQGGKLSAVPEARWADVMAAVDKALAS